MNPRLLAFIAVLSSLAPAQTPNYTQLNKCLGLNDSMVAPLTPIDLCNTQASVSFVAQSTFTVTGIEVFGRDAVLICATISSSGGTASGCGGPYFGGPVQTPKWFTIVVAPTLVAAGSTFSVSVSPSFSLPFGSGALTLYSNTAGAEPLLLTRTCLAVGTCASGTPCAQPPTMENLILRLRGPACTGGVPAIVHYDGTGCGSSPFPGIAGPPAMIGSPFFQVTVSANSSFIQPAYLFFAQGVATSGNPVVPGSPCLSYLNPVSFASLALLGYEPLMSASTGSTGSVEFSLPIAADPSLLGLQVTFQGACTGAGGIPINGVGLRLTQAMTIQIGE